MIRRRPIRAAIAACGLVLASPGEARTILFVGNSFTFGARSPVQYYHPERVTDLNHEGIGGVPALFKTFADEAGLDWTVSLETSPGKTLQWHLANKRGTIDAPWDVVILQGYSVLDPRAPGDAAEHIAAARTLATLFHQTNPRVVVDLVSTWTRPDQTFVAGGHWFGQPVERMADDLAAANARALAGDPDLHAAIPVGQAFSRAIHDDIADTNPYDGIDAGKVDLWADDQYHASAAGYYLEALCVFGAVTGVDPETLGAAEKAAGDLGIDPRLAAALRRVASVELSVRAHGSGLAEPLPRTEEKSVGRRR